MCGKQDLFLGVLFVFTSVAWTAPYNTVKIKTKTPKSFIDIEYPQGFANKQVDLRIKTFIDKLGKSYKNVDPINSFPESLQVNFKVKSENPHVLSLLFNIQSQAHGTSPSVERVRTLNFINGNEVKLEQLFKPNSNFLSKIASYCYPNLLKKETANKEWLKSSSKPIKDNYKKWYFNKKGMVFVFNPNQVSKALSGPILVTIPYATLKSWPFTEKKMIIGITYKKVYS